jgi:ribosome-binding factor A
MNRKINRINSLIKKNLSHIIKKNIEKERNNIISVLEISTSHDFSISNIYISIYKNKIETLNTLKNLSFLLRHVFMKNFNLKKTPHFNFILKD